MRNLWLAFLTTLVACSAAPPLPPPDFQLLVGQESETWSADPAPTRVQIEVVEATRRVVLGETSAPASVVTVKNSGFTPGAIATFEATGFDAAGTPLIRGATVPYLVHDLSNTKIPIFVARSSTWSRPPENLGHARNFPVAIVAWHQFVLSAGGEVKDASPALADWYDTVNWKAVKLTNPIPLPRTPKSMVLVGDTLLCIDDTGATWINLDPDDGRQANALAPPGLAFSEVAGGEVFELDDPGCSSEQKEKQTCPRSSYVVGATRAAGDPTSKVLRIPENGVFRSVTLATPRLGAAAGVVAGKLVVWGGSAEGAGAEVLTMTQEAFSPLPFPPDATTGLGLGTLEGSTALLAGGKDPMTGAAAPLRIFDVACAADCAAAELAMAPIRLQRTHIFPFAAGNVLVTGDSDDGEFHAFGVTTSSGTPEIVERPLRERRKGATSMLLPNGQPGVLGGANPETGEPALSIESFFF